RFLRDDRHRTHRPGGRRSRSRRMFLLHDVRGSRTTARRSARALDQKQALMAGAGREADPELTSPHAPSHEGPTFIRGVTIVGAVALVVGNMVGTSMYTLPASLAQAIGPLGIVAWLLTAIGYLGVALVYA